MEAINKEKVKEILNDKNLSSEAKELIEVLIYSKASTHGNNSRSSAIPDFHNLIARKKIDKINNVSIEDKNISQEISDISLKVGKHLREEYTTAFSNMSNSQSEKQVVAKLIEEYLMQEGLCINGYSVEETVKTIQDEVLDYGQFNELIYERDDIEEIRYNGGNSTIKIVSKGIQYNTDIKIPADKAFIIAERMCRNSKNAKPLRKDNPKTIINLGSNIRVTIITDPIARENNNDKRVVQMTIRKQARKPFSKDFLLKQTINNYGYELFNMFIRHGMSIGGYGETDCGKTGTMRSMLHNCLPDDLRGITIAEVDEFNLQKTDEYGNVINNILMWEINPELMDFQEAIRTTLTMTPRLIVLQEMKGAEIIDVFDAAITGHQVVVLFHNESLETLGDRCLDMYKQKGSDISDHIILGKIPHAMPIVYKMAQLGDGSRKIVEIAEVLNYKKETGLLETNILLKYHIDKNYYIEQDGKKIFKVEGHYEAPNFISEKTIEKMKMKKLTDQELAYVKNLREQMLEESEKQSA